MIICLGVVLFLAAAEARAHQDVWLRNEQGGRITASLNRLDPYSPKKTCGACHDYAAITSGYHFQQGFDKMKDGYDPRRPWILSPGMFGNWLPTAAAGRIAAKNNVSRHQIDYSTYDWIGAGHAGENPSQRTPSCGSCHPGGGPMEYGRNARGQADFRKTLSDGERTGAGELDGDYSSRFTPDGKSRFRQSGVVEADCLICHHPDYRKASRDEQLYRRNYRWAATAGSGLGSVRGSIFTGGDAFAQSKREGTDAPGWNLSRRPVVSYAWSNPSLFTAEGRMKGSLIQKQVSSKSCLQCHAAGEAKNTGASFAPANDVHIRAGLTCTDCHPLSGQTKAQKLTHQIAKGKSLTNHVRNDLDGRDMRTCISCHSGKQPRFTRMGKTRQAKNPQSVHAGLFAGATFHTYLISCQSCHIFQQPLRALTLLDMSTGKEYGYTTDDFEGALSLTDYSLPATKPWILWQTRENQYLAAVPKSMQWFGEKMQNGEIRPIPLRYVSQAARRAGNLTTLPVRLPHGSTQKRPTVVSDRDITTMIRILSSAGFSGVTFVSDRTYELKNGKLISSPNLQKEAVYTVEHGVAPLERKLTYGRKGNPDGCMQCHEESSAFFGRQTLKNVREFLKNDYPAPKAPNFVPQYESWGMQSVPSYE
mgnify:CR=1 FL=1